MKTEDILNLDCRKEENKKLLNKLLWKVKPVAKMLEKNNCTKERYAPIELLEQCLHGICIRYGYESQYMRTYYEDNKFVFYSVSMLDKKDGAKWIGNIYGKTLWELVAKQIIKIYGEIRKEQRK